MGARATSPATAIITNAGGVAQVPNDAGGVARAPNINDRKMNKTNQPQETVIPDFHSRGYLPHIENKMLQVITFRLYDSVPREIIEQWKCALALQENTVTAGSTASDASNASDAGGVARAPEGTGNAGAPARNTRNAPARTPHEEQKKLRRMIDDYEDKGYGQCFFRDDRIAGLMESTLFHYEGRHYRLIRWVIMPNHVHVMIELLPGVALSSILQEWKSSTSHSANKLLGRNGVFWMPEYYDRYIRDQHHLKRAIEYIDANPVKAGLADTPSSYRWSSAYHDAVENGSAGDLARNPGDTASEAGGVARVPSGAGGVARVPSGAGEGARAPHEV